MPRNQVTTDELHQFKREQLDALDKAAEARIADATLTDVGRAYALGADSAVRDVLRALEELYMSPEPEHGNEDLRDPRQKLKERAQKLKTGDKVKAGDLIGQAGSEAGEFDGEVTIHFDKPGDLPGAYPPAQNPLKIVRTSGDQVLRGRPIKDQPQA